jgi:hypothetical protein
VGGAAGVKRRNVCRVDELEFGEGDLGVISEDGEVHWKKKEKRIKEKIFSYC